MTTIHEHPPAAREPLDAIRVPPLDLFALVPADLEQPAPPAPKRSHARSAAIALGLFLIVAIVLGTGSGRFPALADDEGTYVAQAWSLVTNGSLAHYTYWYDHPPFGWIQLALLSTVLSPLVGGGPALAGGRAVMLIPALASAGLLYVLARRLSVRRPFAVAAVLLFALSPLAVTSLRMVYLDNLATPWVIGAFVLAASPRGKLWEYTGSAACFAAAVLTKETTLLFLPALVMQVLQNVDRRTRSFCLAAFASVGVLIVLVYPLYALLKGELLPGPGHVSLLEAVRFQLWGRPSTGSVLSAGSLSRQLVDSWLQVDPWLLGMGVVLAVPGLFIRRLRAVSLALAVLVAMALRPGYLPQPYVIALLPFCAVVIAGVLDAAWSKGPRLNGRVAAGSAAVAVAVAAAIVLMVPRWIESDSYAMTANQTAAVPSAEKWIARNVDPRARILVDDTLYVDLVRDGFRPQFGVVWFYKLDFTTNLDPSVARALPRGWRSFDYVVSTAVIRSALAQNPTGLTQVRRALANSRPVATFGTGVQRVELRRITGPGTGSGLLARTRP